MSDNISDCIRNVSEAHPRIQLHVQTTKNNTLLSSLEFFIHNKGYKEYENEWNLQLFQNSFVMEDKIHHFTLK